MAQDVIVRIQGLNKTFRGRAGTVVALNGIDLDIYRGEIFGIIGFSGAGKSTLVRCINLLEQPTSGSITVNGQKLTWMEKQADGKSCMRTVSPQELRQARKKISMIFQGFNLLMQRTCLKNVCFPMELSGVPKAQAEKKALELLDLVGLKEKASAYPAQLSGGMLQRAAAALLLALHPRYILADEPTSALDAENRTLLLELLEKQRETAGILFISHDVAALRALCGTVYVMEHGMLTEQGTMQELLEHPKQAWTKEYAAANRPVNREGWTWTD